jgi:hypothetical protein
VSKFLARSHGVVFPGTGLSWAKNPFSAMSFE